MHFIKKLIKNQIKTDMARNSKEVKSTEFNRIVTGTKIKGELNADTDIRIDGTVDGNINSKGKVVLGKTGIITGELNCVNAEIEGKVNAQIKVTELLSLKASAKVEGDVITKKIAIEPGAVLSGSIDMNQSSNYNQSKAPDVKIKKSAS